MGQYTSNLFSFIIFGISEFLMNITYNTTNNIFFERARLIILSILYIKETTRFSTLLGRNFLSKNTLNFKYK